MKASSLSIPHADKLVHFVFYFVACVLGVLFIREQTKGAVAVKKTVLLMLAFTIGFGAIIEVLQHQFTVNRQGDFFDGLANSVGALCGATLIKRFFSKAQKLKWKF